MDASKVDLAYGDTTVLLAIGLLDYELADYREAANRLGRLLEDRKLGTPMMVGDGWIGLHVKIERADSL